MTADFLNVILPKCRNHKSIVSDKKVTIDVNDNKGIVEDSSLPYLYGYDDDFGTMFTIDHGDTYTYLTKKQVEDSGIEREELWKHAQANFLRFFEKHVKLKQVRVTPDIYYCTLDSNQEATIALFPELIQYLSMNLGLKKASYACPTTQSFILWESDKTEKMEDAIIAYCTELWKTARPKNRVSIIANTLDLSIMEVYFCLQVVKDKDLDEPYLPKHADFEVGQYIVFRGSTYPSPYSRCVVLIVMKTDTSAVGLIINTRSGSPLWKKKGVEGFTLESGGPDSKGSLFFIHRVEEHSSKQEILPGLYFLGNTNDLEKMVQDKEIGEKQVRFFNGACSWKNHDLRRELKLGMWSIHCAKAEDFMGIETNNLLWEKLINENVETVHWKNLREIKFNSPQ